MMTSINKKYVLDALSLTFSIVTLKIYFPLDTNYSTFPASMECAILLTVLRLTLIGII